ncbi:MAG: hypothetical protein J5I90_12640 [Caldilineales bacterium]|nr:hypothetical protein [Caldilineales bacterium]
MSDNPTPQDAARLLAQLRRREEMSHRHVAGSGLAPEMALLRTWQSQRLTTTHADLLQSERYGPACRFFLDDIYAPRDFSQRNHDAERIHDFMMRFLPASTLRTLTLAIELNNFTDDLDEQLLVAMIDQLGLTDAITAEMYAEGYRICDNYEERAAQIRMVTEIGHGLQRLVRIPLVGWTLRLARGPAHRGGWYELQGFLERGFAAFKHMGGGVNGFLRTVESREMRILDQIFTEGPDPFSLQMDGIYE